MQRPALQPVYFLPSGPGDGLLVLRAPDGTTFELILWWGRGYAHTLSALRFGKCQRAFAMSRAALA